MSADLTLAQGLAVTALKSAHRAADRRICALIQRLAFFLAACYQQR